MTWEPEQDHDASIKDSLLIVFGTIIVVLLIIGLLWFLGDVQSAGEAPGYHCRPGETYTRAECT